MNNKGFAITTILYGMLILFLILIVAMLRMLSTYKDRLSLLIEGVNGAREIINTSVLPDLEENINPILEDGMIPVVISNNDGKVITTNVDSDNWYNYSEKKWANAVLIRNHPSIAYNFGTNENKISDGTISGATFVNGGLKFDGTDDYVKVPLNADNMTSFTIEIEFTFGIDPVSGKKYDIFSNFQTGGFGLQVHEKKLKFIFYDAGRATPSYVQISTNEYVTKNGKYFATAVFDEGKVSFYVNGKLIGNYTMHGNLRNSDISDVFMLGCPLGKKNGAISCTTSDGVYFNGILHSARFYNKVLTEDVIKNNHEGKVDYSSNDLLVSYDFRNNRKSYVEGDEISQDEVLAYYVWIPRYKYKINESDESIKIYFEKNEDVMNNDGNNITHPAFWWDSDSNGEVNAGEMRSGFWVGKFETTGTASLPTILPNKNSLVSQDVKTQFSTSLKFAGGKLDGSSVAFSGNSLYGITSKIDSHMMKNSEWGAVAYLTYSDYGNKNIVNNRYLSSSKYLTGCGNSSGKIDTSSTTTCENKYGTLGDSVYLQSTTGNISGIFDMSGGAWDVVMGVYGSKTSNTGFSTMPDSKYYDSFNSSNMCCGHALGEISSWVTNEGVELINADNPWLYRGGRVGKKISNGMFYYGRATGKANALYSWRSVLISN